jgi:hypothetical protein
MTKRSSRWFNLGLLLILLGALLGIVYAGIAVWGDWEAFSFRMEDAIRSDKTFRGLRCPVLMTTRETERIHAILKNPTDKELTRSIRVFITEGDAYNARTLTEKARLGPGESQRFSWEIRPEDRVYDMFVLVRAFVFRSGSLPSQDASCGVMVLDLPFGRGDAIVLALVAASLAAMAVGMWLMRGNSPAASERAHRLGQKAKAMAVFALAAMIAGSFGWFLLGGVALILFLLLAVISVMQAFSAS